MKKLINKLAITLIGIFICSIAFPQINFKQKEVDGNNYFATMADNAKQTATLQNETAVIKQITNSNPNIEFRFKSSYVDDLKFTHKKYTTFFKGIEVIGMDFVIHEKHNIVQYVNGTFQNIENTTSKATINEMSANNFAKAYFKVNSKSKIITKLSVENKGLCLIKNPLNKKANYELAYKILIDPNSANGKYVFVSALDGTVITYENLVCTTNAPGGAQTRYSGTKSFTTDQQGGQYRLREIRNGVNIKTLNANYESNEEVIVNTATDFWDYNDNNWTLAEHQVNQVATDAHWAMEKTYDYWLSTHNRNSINNAGMDIVSYIHFGNSVDNAFWNGSKNSMFFGDGSTYFSPLTSLDICAHEFGHGICQYTSNLFYGYGTESSALNEGFSDIWGASVEAYAAPNKQRWLIGEEITLVNPGYLRSMSNPPSGAFIPSADTYGDANWNNEPDAHYRSGVLNKWYFLLSDGGTGTNGIGNVYNVTGISISKAERIAYRTEQLLNSNANYALARTMSIQATQELYGASSCEEIAVIKAWYAVGVGANYTGSIPTPVIAGNNALCANSSSNYTIDGSTNCLINITNNWTITNSNGSSTIATVSPTNGNTTTVSVPASLTSGGLTLIATLSNGTVITKNIHIGSPTFGATYSNGRVNNLPIAYYFPPQGSNNIFNEVCIGATFPNLFADAQPIGASSVVWNVPSGYQTPVFSFMQQTGNRAYFGFNYNPSNSPGYLQATVSNSCGSSSNIFGFKQLNCGTQTDPCAFAKNQKYFTVSPNPTSRFIKIGIGSKPPPDECPLMKTMTTSKGIVFSIVNVYDRQGSLLKTMQQKEAKSATVGLDNFNCRFIYS